MREGMMSEGSDENIYKPYTGQRSICGSRTTAGGKIEAHSSHAVSLWLHFTVQTVPESCLISFHSILSPIRKSLLFAAF